MFEGAYVAIVTPFTKDGEKLDETQFKKLVNEQIQAGIDGIVVSGTTGESPALSAEEKRKLIDLAIDFTGNRVPVIAGTGTSSTNETIQLTQYAENAGCEGALIVCPPYNKPTKSGLHAHYAAVESETDLPIILYDNPGRSATSIPAETVIDLSDLDGIHAIKEASGDLTHSMKIREHTDLNLLSGSDALTYPLLALGGTGVITVTANVCPGEMSSMVHAYLRGEHEQSRRAHEKLFPLMDLLMSETNPIPVKAALAMKGDINGELRPPLTDARKDTREKIQRELQRLGQL